MLIPIYSNGTYGTVVGLKDDTHTISLPTIVNNTPQWPTRLATKQENSPVKFILTHPTDGRTKEITVVFDAQTIVEKPEIYQQWEDAGLITPELFQAIPEPDDIKLNRLKNENLTLVDTWFKTKTNQGIEVNGSILKASTTDATQYQAEISVAVSLSTNPIISDINGDLIHIPLNDVLNYISIYYNKLTTRRLAADNAKKAILAATTEQGITDAFQILVGVE